MPLWACGGLQESLGAGRVFQRTPSKSMKQSWGRCWRGLPRVGPRSLTRYARLGVCESPRRGSPAWSYSGSTAPLSIRGVWLHGSKVTPVCFLPSAEVAP